MDDSGLLIVVAGLGGAIVGALGALGATFLAHRYEAERDRKNDQRSRRNVKTDRVRRVYADLLAGARASYYVAVSFPTVDDPRDVPRLMEELRKSTDHLAVSLALVSLEDDSNEVARLFEEIRDAFNECSMNLESVLKNPDQRELARRKMDSALAALREHLPRLEGAARVHLARIEQPI